MSTFILLTVYAVPVLSSLLRSNLAEFVNGSAQWSALAGHMVLMPSAAHWTRGKLVPVRVTS